MSAEDARLLAMLQLGLEAHHVVERAERVVLAQLHHGIGPRPVRGSVEAHRLHRPEAQGIGPRAAITSIGRQPSK